MSELHLGTEFEVHGGGLDLVFPHHENELAQSRALGHRFAKFWMHNGLLRLGDAEMHKSLGNVVTLQNALATWGRETLLLFYATGHWRKPLDFTDETLGSAAARAERFRDVFRSPSETAPEGSWERFAAALDDDFNTPEALAAMHEWRDHDLLSRALEIFGLESLAELPDAPPEVLELARERAQARAELRFDDADALRRRIEDSGWIVRDSDAEFQLVPRS
jgi:cysteinyl-tRNA synthetase